MKIVIRIVQIIQGVVLIYALLLERHGLSSRTDILEVKHCTGKQIADALFISFSFIDYKILFHQME